MAQRPTIYGDLSRSICPSVYGHDPIKQAILLMLFGGVHKRTVEVSGAAKRRTARALAWNRLAGSAPAALNHHSSAAAQQRSSAAAQQRSSAAAQQRQSASTLIQTPKPLPRHQPRAQPPGHQPARRHQPGHHRGPLLRQEPAAQVRRRLFAARRVHQRQGLHRRRSDGVCGQGAAYSCGWCFCGAGVLSLGVRLLLGGSVEA